MYPRGGARTVNVANPTNGYAAEKGISKVVSDGEWKPLAKMFLKYLLLYYKTLIFTIAFELFLNF